jgi:predicted DNA-binding transcriptional regulator AlpA
MAARSTTTADKEEPRDRIRTKNRAEHHAALLAGLANQLAKHAGDADAYSLAEFCRRHGISLQLFYKLIQQGQAPATFRVGTRVLVSKEAAARWRAEREAVTAADA